MLQDLGPHSDYVSPIPPVAHAMPPPAARPRNSYGGAAATPAAPRPGGSKPSAGAAGGQKARPKTTVRPSGGSGSGKLGAAPFNQAALEARLAVADLPELAGYLASISKRERVIMAELEGAGLMDEALSRSLMEREELVRQVIAH